MSRVSLVLALFFASTLAWACASNSQTNGDAAGASEVVARVNDQQITLAELDQWIREDLFTREVASKAPPEQYDYRSKALERLIQERVIEDEAVKRGVSEDAVIESEILELGPVTDDEIEQFFEDNKARLGQNAELQALSPRIRSYLERQRRTVAIMSLREKAAVQIEIEPPRVTVAASGPSLGPEDAPITIVEFSDYQCPFCKRAEDTMKSVLERYPDRVRFVYRHMPLDSLHPRARAASEAAVCAEEQNRFWEFHAKIFENQKSLSDEDLDRFASEVGLDTKAFAQCRESDKVRERVQRDVDAGREVGVRGTPAFFVNGIMLSGAQPVEEFVEVIEAELARNESASSS